MAQRTSLPDRRPGRPGEARPLVAGLLACLLALAGASLPPEPARAEPTEGGQTPLEKVSDVPSFHDYPGVQALDGESVYNQSRNPGRIWTDKTVFASPEDFPDDADYAPDLADDELAVALSALGSTRQIESTRAVAIDLVLVLDNSRSMVQCVGSEANCNSPGNYTDSRAPAGGEARRGRLSAGGRADARPRTRA